MKDQFVYPKQKIKNVIKGIPEQDRLSYPQHISEPERIEIARELALKEYYKLFPFLQASDFANLGNAMIEWFDGRKSEMVPIHDYWNFIGGMLVALKLKDTVSYLTSENITWRLRAIDPKSVSLYWAVGTLSRHGKVDQDYNYEFVKTNILNNPDELAKNIKISDKKAEDTVVNRDHFPILVLQDLNKDFKLLDGNRRVMRAWLYNYRNINAWVGTVKNDPIIFNHWVGTDFLRRLLTQYTSNSSNEVFESVRSQLKILFEMSSIAKSHYKKRCLHIQGAKELAKGLLDL